MSLLFLFCLCCLVMQRRIYFYWLFFLSPLILKSMCSILKSTSASWNRANWPGGHCPDCQIRKAHGLESEPGSEGQGAPTIPDCLCGHPWATGLRRTMCWSKTLSILLQWGHRQRITHTHTHTRTHACQVWCQESMPSPGVPCRRGWNDSLRWGTLESCIPQVPADSSSQQRGGKRRREALVE
jgi:hypothetical protein